MLKGPNWCLKGPNYCSEQWYWCAKFEKDENHHKAFLGM